MDADELTTREMWLMVARAAAEPRRVTEAGDGIFYSDLTLRESADARAWGELTRSIRRAADARVGEEEIVDALCSGDQRLEVSEAVELVAWARTRDERLRELNRKVLNDLLREELMGWGQEPHEGWGDDKLREGRWLGPTRRGGDPDPVARQAVCSCGWRSEREHPVPPRPAEFPRDERGLPYGPEYDAWIAALEAAQEACWEDWNAEHYQPLLGYEPHTQLILGRTEGGPRHFLDGRPVHAGATLELPLDDGHWLQVRYEWSWQRDVPPTAHFALGVPASARGLADAPAVSFELPPRAILRWPQRERSR